jgi:hypothetical protein
MIAGFGLLLPPPAGGRIAGHDREEEDKGWPDQQGTQSVQMRAREPGLFSYAHRTEMIRMMTGRRMKNCPTAGSGQTCPLTVPGRLRITSSVSMPIAVQSPDEETKPDGKLPDRGPPAFYLD